MTVSAIQVQSVNCKGSCPKSGYSKWYWQDQESVYCPEVEELARRIGLALNGCWNFWWIFYFPDGKHLFMGEGHSIVTILSNDQNSSLVCTCSLLIALSCPSNVPNFTTTLPPTSSNQLHKYQKFWLSKL